MKKLLYCAAALALGIFAGSCQRENLEPVAGGGVTYTIALPEIIQTKGENGYAEYDLYVEVYKTADLAELETAPLLFEKTEVITAQMNGKISVGLDLLNDQDYTILFWANKKGGMAWFNTADLRNVQMKQSASNNDDRDAYCAMDQILNHNGTIAKTVELKRPFAQINIATVVPDADEIGYDVTPKKSLVKVAKIPVAYNVATSQSVGEDVEVTYALNAIPDGYIATDYRKVAMNYVLVPEGTVDVYYEINTANGTVKNTVANVPVKANYRTNIIGNLLTSNATYTVEIKPGFETDGKENMFVENEGVVKNVNGAYEISNANGLAYAINNLFAQGGDFYLTAAEYDMTGFVLNPVTVEAGKTLNLYGETPVVTRSAIAGVIIKGLTDALIDSVQEGGSLSVSGVNLPETGSVLVDDNKGTLVVSETTADTIINTGNDPVDANDVKDLAALKAALATGVKVINLTEDIEASEVVFVDRSVVINGNENTFTTSAKRAFRLIASGIEVTFNNLDIVSKAVRVGNADVRGVSIDGTSEITGEKLENITLTLNNCSHDFTDKSANDWAYAVNVVGGKGYKVTVNGGTYEGANVINVWGENHSISVDRAVLTSLYPANDYYYGYCISLLNATGCTLNVVNTTFNGSNAIAYIKDDVNNTVIAENNDDNTMYYKNTDDGAVFNVSSVEKLQEAINMAKPQTSEIKFVNDITGNVTITQKEGVNLVINGNGYKFDGVITVDGNSRATGAETLTFQNIEFETAGTDFTFITAPSKINGHYNYSHNVTIDGCTFSGNQTVGSASFTGTYNFVMKNSSATGMHSILQVQSCDNDVLVDNVTVNGCKNGISFGNTAFPTLKNSTINAVEYGVRADGDASRGNLVIENTTINAATPVVVRKMTADSYNVAVDEASELNPAGKYHAVFTSGQDDEAYVAPSAKWNITGADDYFVYPREVVAATSEDVDASIKAGVTTIYLAEGTYVMPASAQKKTLAFIGIGEAANTKIATNNVTGSYEGCNYAFDGSTVTLENISINTPSTNYIGYARCKGTYIDCIINGTYTLYDSSVFENCIFNVSGDVYNVWTWGAATATFTGCTFNSDGKAMLLYGQANTKLTIENSVFNDNGGLADHKAAIEIGNDYDSSYELVVNNTVVNGYDINDKGIYTGTTLWANKNSMPKDKLNVIVDGVDVY